jgi:cobalt-zinc-cadmium efflux system outer membrane protein
MKKAFIVTALVGFGFNLFAQNSIDKVLVEVEKNNTTLSAYRKSVDAEKIGSKVGLTPQNPEVEFNYLWGSPSAIGNRTDFSIKQSFDFPTAYRYKTQISNLKNEQAELDYKKQRNEVLYQTRVLCTKLVYQNVLKSECNLRYADALQVANAYKAKYSTGDVGILDYNKSQIHLLSLTKELERIEIERTALLSELAMLNGGIPMDLNDSLFTGQSIPANFELWYAQIESMNPLLQWVKQEVAISAKQYQLNIAMSLPKLYAGYMSEKVTGQQFQGVTVGMSIPLWENKNRGRYAKAKSLALQSIETDTKLKFYNDMKATYGKAIALQNSVLDYREKLTAFSNDKLLRKAFDKGEISLAEYMYELSLNYESKSTLLEMEMNLNMAIAELDRYR